MAGANPHATVVKTVTISENNKAEELNVIAASGGMVPEGIRATITCNPKMAKMQPRAQLTAANAKLSTNNCLMICVRLAPTADRMQNSLSRVVARARREFAKLLQAMSSKIVPPPMSPGSPSLNVAPPDWLLGGL